MNYYVSASPYLSNYDLKFRPTDKYDDEVLDPILLNVTIKDAVVDPP
jgi:hypothetical protein